MRSSRLPFDVLRLSWGLYGAALPEFATARSTAIWEIAPTWSTVCRAEHSSAVVSFARSVTDGVIDHRHRPEYSATNRGKGGGFTIRQGCRLVALGRQDTGSPSAMRAPFAKTVFRCMEADTNERFYSMTDPGTGATRTCPQPVLPDCGSS